jgi:hypothetical protein
MNLVFYCNKILSAGKYTRCEVLHGVKQNKETVMIKKVWFLILTAAATVMADSTVFWFDPNDLIDVYTAGDSSSYRPDQESPRLVYQRDPLDLSKMAATFTDSRYAPNPPRWTGNDNYYADWMAGLSDGEGIQAFNIWVTTAGYLGSVGNPYSRSDILQQMYSLSNNMAGWSGTASGGWQAEVSMVYSDAVDGVSYGIKWSTTNPAAYLRPGGMDIGQFSFTLNGVAVNSSGDSPVVGQNYNFWFGSHDVVFDEAGWGTSSTGAVFSSTAENHAAGWEGSMRLSAQAIPEPASAMLVLFGAGAGTAVYRARRSAMRR